MSFQTDYLLRIIERLGEAIAKLVAGGDTSEAESALEEITGLSLDRIDAMPPLVLGRLLWAREDRRQERFGAVISTLEAFAEHGAETLAEARREKATYLRGLAERG